MFYTLIKQVFDQSEGPHRVLSILKFSLLHDGAEVDGRRSHQVFTNFSTVSIY